MDIHPPRISELLKLAALLIWQQLASRWMSSRPSAHPRGRICHGLCCTMNVETKGCFARNFGALLRRRGAFAAPSILGYIEYNLRLWMMGGRRGRLRQSMVKTAESRPQGIRLPLLVTLASLPPPADSCDSPCHALSSWDCERHCHCHCHCHRPCIQPPVSSLAIPHDGH